VKGGALEAFIGALYEIAGFEDTRRSLFALLAEEMDRYDPAPNYIGRLQEWHQQHGSQVPVYTEVKEKGRVRHIIPRLRTWFSPHSRLNLNGL